MLHNPRFTGIHSSPKERQLQKSCVSFGQLGIPYRLPDSGCPGYNFHFRHFSLPVGDQPKITASNHDELEFMIITWAARVWYTVRDP